MQEAIEDVLGSTGNEEKHIVILPREQHDTYATDVGKMM